METSSSSEPTNTPPVQSSVPHDDIQENKDLAAISYVWILAVVIYVTKHQSPFVNFHAKQALILFALSLIVGILGVFGNLLLIIILAFCVLGFLNAAQGLKKDLPIIGPMARGDIHGLKASFGGIWSSVSSFWKKNHTTAKQTPPKPTPTAPSVVVDVESTPSPSPSDPPSPPAQ